MVTLARRQLALPSMGWHSAARHSHKRMLSSSIGNRVGVTARAWVGMGLVALVLAGAGQAAAPEDVRLPLARELAHLMLDDTVRRGLEDQVGSGMVRAVAATLEERLNRRLLEVEWQLLADIVRRFVAETLPRDRTEEIAAEAYARHFDEAELRELLRFQQSAVGRKAARLTPVIASETAQAIDGEIRSSPGLPRMLAALQRAFPVLKP